MAGVYGSSVLALHLVDLHWGSRFRRRSQTLPLKVSRPMGATEAKECVDTYPDNCSGDQMSIDRMVFFAIGGVFLGFIALRPNTVVWLLSYGKPNLVSQATAKIFQMAARFGLLLLGASVIFDLARSHH